MQPVDSDLELELELAPRQRTLSFGGVQVSDGVTDGKSGGVGGSGTGGSFAGSSGGAINLAMIDRDEALPPSVGHLQSPPSGVALLEVPSEDPIRRRLSSNVMVTKKRIKNAKASPEVTMMHIFRSFVGAGILSMPYAFSHAGVLFAPIGLLAVGAVVVFSCFCLVSAASG